MDVPIEIYQEILEYSDFLTQIRLTQICKYLLDASNNNKITDEGIKHMNLHTLDVAWNKKITDKGIKHMTNLKNIFRWIP